MKIIRMQLVKKENWWKLLESIKIKRKEVIGMILMKRKIDESYWEALKKRG